MCKCDFRVYCLRPFIHFQAALLECSEEAREALAKQEQLLLQEKDRIQAEASM